MVQKTMKDPVERMGYSFDDEKKVRKSLRGRFSDPRLPDSHCNMRENNIYSRDYKIKEQI